MFQYRLLEMARENKKRIALPEGSEPRILRAAEELLRRDICEVCLLGNGEEIRETARSIGVAIDGAEIYTTASPCWNCFKLIANSGIREIYYGEFYRDERIIRIANEIKMKLSHIPTDIK